MWMTFFPEFHFFFSGPNSPAHSSSRAGELRLLGPMQSASALFAARVLSQRVAISDPRYRNALFHLMVSQTSCFRYWGGGIWTDYGGELCRRTIEILNHDF